MKNDDLFLSVYFQNLDASPSYLNATTQQKRVKKNMTGVARNMGVWNERKNCKN